VCENFIFFAPLILSTATESLFEVHTAQPGIMRGGHPIGGVPQPQVIVYEARMRPMRRFKMIGLHCSSIGECEDLLLVEKMNELLDSLKIGELDENLASNAELTDRDRMRKLKKRALGECEFAAATLVYLHQCTKKKSEGDRSASPTEMRSVSELLEERRNKRVRDEAASKHRSTVLHSVYHLAQFIIHMLCS
jgi:hypothetical protein